VTAEEFEKLIVALSQRPDVEVGPGLKVIIGRLVEEWEKQE
jgi:hypothetical protein